VASVLVGLVVAVVEWLLYAPEKSLTALVGLSCFHLLFWLAAALLLVAGRAMASAVASRLFASEMWRWEGREGWGWVLFFWLFFMAFVPYPLFHLLGSLSVTITDVTLLVRFTSGAALLVVAASGLLSLLLAVGVYRLLTPLGLLSVPLSLPMFWGLAFPTPWVLIPLTVVILDREELAPAARLVLPALGAVGLPLLLGLLRRLPRLAQRAAAALATAAALLLVGLGAAGVTYSAGAVAAAPVASSVFQLCRSLADLDGDGYAYLFEGMDCDESAPQTHRLAFDVPDNGIDEDCDGVDARRSAGLRLGDGQPFPFKDAHQYNFLFIVIDALRADHVHFYGYKRETTPNLDRLAERSLVFTNAVAQYPSTGISVPSMLAGRYPEYMVWGKPRRRSHYVLKDDNLLITDVLREHGYVTRAVVSAWIKRNIGGFARHFHKLVGLYPHKEWKKWVRDSSRLTVSRAIEFFERYDGRKPFFAFLHFEDPHEPYVNHSPPGRVFGRKALDRYDSDIYWADLWMGFLLGYLDQKPWMEDTVIIVVSDHGEEFKDHGKRFHGHQIYQESIHVPLVIHIPGQPPLVVDERVALVDLFPTILDLTGIPHDRARLQGVSLLRTAAGGGGLEPRPVFSMLADREKRPTYRCKVVLRGDFKLILDLTNDRQALFNLAADPREKHDLASEMPAVREELRALLSAFLLNSDPSWKKY